MLKNFIPAILILVAGMLIQTKRVFDAQKEVKDYKAKCDSIQHVSDSLRWELLPVEIELSRYETAYDIFMRRNPNAASQYGDIISNETE
jgi:cell division protein FtsL